MTDGREMETVRLAQAGDEVAFASLVDRYAKPVLNFIWRIMGDATESEDVAQDTFVRAWQHLNAYHKTDAAFSSWLFQIARNAALDRLRKPSRKSVMSLDDFTVDLSAPQPQPDQMLEQSELATAIANAVAALPEDHRTAFVLAEYHGQSVREIATVMHCSEKSIEGRLYRARRTLRVALSAWSGPAS